MNVSKLELLTVLYTLDELLELDNMAAAKKVIKKIIAEAENGKDKQNIKKQVN
jgi:hypothetical protein